MVSSSNCGVAPVASVPMSTPAFLIPRMPSPVLPLMTHAPISAWAFRSTRTPLPRLFWIVFEKICAEDPRSTWMPVAPLFWMTFGPLTLLFGGPVNPMRALELFCS